VVEEHNVFKGKLEERPVSDARTIHSSDFLPGIIQQRHIKAPFKVVKFGLAADRPDGGSDVKAYFATDTGALSMWNGSAWLSVTLS
jgi:hypothetical protein